MKRFVCACALVAVAVVTASQFSLSQAPASGMSFFITSAGPGDGANLGGLTGADAHCQKLASAAGSGGRTWRAYLSAAASGNPGPLVAHFTGNDAGKLPCPVMVIPGSLSEERLEQLS